MARPGCDPRAAERRDVLLVRHAARHHDGSLNAFGRAAHADLESVLRHRRHARASRLLVAADEVPRLLRRADRRRQHLRPGRERLERLRGRGRLLPLVHRRLHGGRRRARVPPHDRRGADRCPERVHGRQRRAHVRQRERPHVSGHRELGHSRRRCSIPAATTTTGTRGPGWTRRTPRGSCGSTARRSLPSTCPGLAPSRPTSPACSARRAAPPSGTRASTSR